MNTDSDSDRWRCRRPALLTCMLALSISATVLQAQLDLQPILSAQFSFSNPGARSLGLGGAFVALADDATAAWANPAGLVQISRPEVSVEGRYWNYSKPFVVGGNLGGEPSGVGLDTVTGLRTERAEFDTRDLAFLSIVFPTGRWSVAFYRHLFASIEVELATEGMFAGGVDRNRFRYADQRNLSRLDIASYGLSAAYRASDALSFGVGLIYYDSASSIDTDLYLWDDLDDPFGSSTSYLPERFIYGQTIFSDSDTVSGSAGFLWRITPGWSVGGRYREGPILDLRGLLRVGGALDLGLPPGSVIELLEDEQAELPDSWGLGASYRSHDGSLTVSFEWNRVTYSDPAQSLDLDDQEIDDADELRVGGEWVFLASRPLIALRAGLWYDPDHATRSNERADEVARALLQPGTDEIHYAFGIGAAFASWQLDAAFDLSESVSTASLSVIYSF